MIKLLRVRTKMLSCSCWIDVAKSILLCTLVLVATPTLEAGEPNSEHASHHPKSASSDRSVPVPLAALEKALDDTTTSGSSIGASRPDQGQSALSAPPKAEQSASISAPGPSESSSPPAPPGMGGPGGEMMGKEMMGMMAQMMGKMGEAPSAMKSPKSSSEVPGIPGVSHLYHLGATGFYLDHPELISLTPEQRAELNHIKETAVLNQATFERRIAQGEQDIWALTGQELLNIDGIDTKSKYVEAQRSESRLALIRSVTAAAKVLTPDQRSVLLGKSPAPKQMAGTVAPDASQETAPSAQNPQAGMNGGGAADKPRDTSGSASGP